MTTTQKTSKAPTKLQQEAMQLFGVASVDKVSTVLWALGIRSWCGRCLGSGHYSRNSFGDTRCYDCKGRKERAAELTRKTLDAARVKVEAGELETLREQGRDRVEARKMVAPKVEAGRAIYVEIADAYEAAYRAETLRIDGALFLAQGVNNALFWGECPSRAFRRAPAPGMRGIERAVQEGRLDAVKGCAELDALLAMLTELRDAWRAWNAAQRAQFRAGAHARLAA